MNSFRGRWNMRTGLYAIVGAALLIVVPTVVHAQPLPPSDTDTPLIGLPSGAPPAGVTVTGTPAKAHVSWLPAANASAYYVERWNQADPNCCRAASGQLPADTTGWDDLLQSSGTWVYRVGVKYANRRVGSLDVTYKY